MEKKCNSHANGNLLYLCMDNGCNDKSRLACLQCIQQKQHQSHIQKLVIIQDILSLPDERQEQSQKSTFKQSVQQEIIENQINGASLQKKATQNYIEREEENLINLKIQKIQKKLLLLTQKLRIRLKEQAQYHLIHDMQKQFKFTQEHSQNIDEMKNNLVQALKGRNFNNNNLPEQYLKLQKKMKIFLTQKLKCKDLSLKNEIFEEILDDFKIILQNDSLYMVNTDNFWAFKQISNFQSSFRLKNWGKQEFERKKYDKMVEKLEFQQMSTTRQLINFKFKIQNYSYQFELLGNRVFQQGKKHKWSVAFKINTPKKDTEEQNNRYKAAGGYSILQASLGIIYDKQEHILQYQINDNGYSEGDSENDSYYMLDVLRSKHLQGVDTYYSTSINQNMNFQSEKIFQRYDTYQGYSEIMQKYDNTLKYYCELDLTDTSNAKFKVWPEINTYQFQSSQQYCYQQYKKQNRFNRNPRGRLGEFDPHFQEPEYFFDYKQKLNFRPFIQIQGQSESDIQITLDIE